MVNRNYSQVPVNAKIYAIFKVEARKRDYKVATLFLAYMKNKLKEWGVEYESEPKNKTVTTNIKSNE